MKKEQGDEIPVIPELIVTVIAASQEIVAAAKRTHPEDMKEAQELALKISRLIVKEDVGVGVAMTAVAAVFGCTLEALTKRGVQ